MEQISEHPCFVIFNKQDVLEEKIKAGVKLSQHVQEFVGNDLSVEEVCEFIVGSYLKLDTHARIVKTFRMSALNAQHVKSCFETILEQVDESMTK